MSEPGAAMDDATLKCGLLMESAQAHQKLAETQLDRLRLHTQQLDGVVRDEIRRTLTEELTLLTAETTRTVRALAKVRHAARLRSVAWSAAAAVIFTAVPIAVAHWVLPSTSEIASLRARRDELASRVTQLQQAGGAIDWRRCGSNRKLCVRVDRKAPSYGEDADFYIVAGY